MTCECTHTFQLLSVLVKRWHGICVWLHSMNAIGVHIVRFVCNLCSMSLSDRSISVCVRAVCCSSERERKRWNVCIDGRECVPLSYHRENIVFAVLVGWLLSFRLTRYPIHLLHFSGLSHQFDCYNTDSTHRKTEKKAKASIIHSCSSCEYTRASNAKYSLKDEREREKKSITHNNRRNKDYDNWKSIHVEWIHRSE